jgi:hypothetical protein
MKIKISRREAKESIFWLGLILIDKDDNLEQIRNILLDECSQLQKILSAILIKLNSKA